MYFEHIPSQTSSPPYPPSPSISPSYSYIHFAFYFHATYVHIHDLMHLYKVWEPQM